VFIQSVMLYYNTVCSVLMFLSMFLLSFFFFFFFFNDTATTEIYTLSLHDALPIYPFASSNAKNSIVPSMPSVDSANGRIYVIDRSEEHTSELQSRSDLVCRLLLEKKKKKKNIN